MRRPLVVAHRGASRDAPENTPEAFRLAALQGADAVELDVRRTAEGALVVHHDPLTPDGLVIGAVSRRELGAAVCGLDDALAAFGGRVNVEVKHLPGEPGHDPDAPVVDEVAAALDRLGAAERCWVSSFNPRVVAEAAERGLAVGLLVVSDVARALEVCAERGWALHPRWDLVTAGLAERARRSGVDLHVWTVDDPVGWRTLVGFGVAGIITNVPGDLRRFLSAETPGT